MDPKPTRPRVRDSGGGTARRQRIIRGAPGPRGSLPCTWERQVGGCPNDARVRHRGQREQYRLLWALPCNFCSRSGYARASKRSSIPWAATESSRAAAASEFPGIYAVRTSADFRPEPVLSRTFRFQTGSSLLASGQSRPKESKPLIFPEAAEISRSNSFPGPGPECAKYFFLS